MSHYKPDSEKLEKNLAELERISEEMVLATITVQYESAEESDILEPLVITKGFKLERGLYRKGGLEISFCNTLEFKPTFKGMKEKDIHKIKYGDDYICGYDEKGNRIYYENNGDHWMKWEYDTEYNQIYYENGNGLWTKWEYDEEGELVSRTEGKKLLTKKNT